MDVQSIMPLWSCSIAYDFMFLFCYFFSNIFDDEIQLSFIYFYSWADVRAFETESIHFFLFDLFCSRFLLNSVVQQMLLLLKNIFKYQLLFFFRKRWFFVDHVSMSNLTFKSIVRQQLRRKPQSHRMRQMKSSKKRSRSRQLTIPLHHQQCVVSIGSN